MKDMPISDIFDTPSGQKRQEGADIIVGEVVTGMSDEEDTLKLNSSNQIINKVFPFENLERGTGLVKI